MIKKDKQEREREREREEGTYISVRQCESQKHKCIQLGVNDLQCMRASRNECEMTRNVRKRLAELCG
jgi:hypothetical protein